MNTLFIGGQEDGKWKDIPNKLDVWDVPEETEDLPVDTPMHDIFQVFRYNRITLIGNRYGRETEHSIMLISDKDMCPIEELLRGYRPQLKSA